jgi:hypothetical protein
MSARAAGGWDPLVISSARAPVWSLSFTAAELATHCLALPTRSVARRIQGLPIGLAGARPW